MKSAHAAKSSFCAESPSIHRRQQSSFLSLPPFLFSSPLLVLFFSIVSWATLTFTIVLFHLSPYTVRVSLLSAEPIRCAIGLLDARKSLRPRLASSAAAMEAMVCNLESRSGHDQWWASSNGGVCASLAAQARRCGHGIRRLKVAAACRFDTRSVLSHVEEGKGAQNEAGDGG